jgi:hypothetical protein
MSHDIESLLIEAADTKDYRIRMQGDSAIYRPDVPNNGEND